MARFVGRHAAGYVVGGLELEMIFELVFPFRLSPLVAAEEAGPLSFFYWAEYLVDGVYQAVPAICFQAEFLFA